MRVSGGSSLAAHDLADSLGDPYGQILPGVALEALSAPDELGEDDDLEIVGLVEDPKRVQAQVQRVRREP